MASFIKILHFRHYSLNTLFRGFLCKYMTESNIDRHMAHQIAFTTKSKETDAPENYTATVITKNK